MTITAVDSNFKVDELTTTPVVLKAPYPGWEQLLVKGQVNTDSDVKIRSLVEMIQTAGTDVDRYDITATTDESKTIFGIVPDTVANRKQLEIDNSGVAWTYALTFAADSYVEVLPLIPGFVLSVNMTAQQGTVLPGKRMVNGGSGAVKIHPDDLAVSTHTTGTTVTTTTTGIPIDPTVAVMLARCTTSASAQVVPVLVK